MNKKYSPNLGLFLDNLSFAALQVCLTKAPGIAEVRKLSEIGRFVPPHPSVKALK